jgi:hypothetical protein
LPLPPGELLPAGEICAKSRPAGLPWRALAGRRKPWQVGGGDGPVGLPWWALAARPLETVRGDGGEIEMRFGR